MPSYDGGGNAPSGVEFHHKLREDESRMLQLPLRVYRERGDWYSHIEGLEPSQDPDWPLTDDTNKALLVFGEAGRWPAGRGWCLELWAGE
jgi:hypothetical protein